MFSGLRQVLCFSLPRRKPFPVVLGDVFSGERVSEVPESGRCGRKELVSGMCETGLPFAAACRPSVICGGDLAGHSGQKHPSALRSSGSEASGAPTDLGGPLPLVHLGPLH